MIIFSFGDCICCGKEVPFYCPKHGQVENPEWVKLMEQQKAMRDGQGHSRVKETSG